MMDMDMNMKMNDAHMKVCIYTMRGASRPVSFPLFFFFSSFFLPCDGLDWIAMHQWRRHGVHGVDPI
jgi:hypothetical protein